MRILEKIDRILCHYFGLKEIKTIPHLVHNKRRELTILNTESFRRYPHKIIFSEITCNDFYGMDKESKEKLGVAIGKTIAANLVISFDKIAVIKEKSHEK